LTLFKEIIVIYSDNHMKYINTKCRATDWKSMWYIQFPLVFKGLISSESYLGGGGAQLWYRKPSF
jgi:hypothetical protein